jgi:hypothetical protein
MAFNHFTKNSHRRSRNKYHNLLDSLRLLLPRFISAFRFCIYTSTCANIKPRCTALRSARTSLPLLPNRPSRPPFLSLPRTLSRMQISARPKSRNGDSQHWPLMLTRRISTEPAPLPYTRQRPSRASMVNMITRGVETPPGEDWVSLGIISVVSARTDMGRITSCSTIRSVLCIRTLDWYDLLRYDLAISQAWRDGTCGRRHLRRHQSALDVSQHARRRRCPALGHHPSRVTPTSSC